MDFPCNQCGQCCRNISKVEPLAEFDNGTGVCIHLQGNLCKIYTTRPWCCNVEATYQRLFAEIMSEEEFVAKNVAICKTLRE